MLDELMDDLMDQKEEGATDKNSGAKDDRQQGFITQVSLVLYLPSTQQSHKLNAAATITCIPINSNIISSKKTMLPCSIGKKPENQQSPNSPRRFILEWISEKGSDVVKTQP